MWKNKALAFYRRFRWPCKAAIMSLLPLICCMAYCAMQGGTIREVYLPACDWNDELFYYKQVEGILGYGFPQGYFGFNESHALRLSFAAWSPVLVLPWVLWGLAFGWNLMSPVYCNIALFLFATFCFVLLVRPSNRQLGILALLQALFLPFYRYMLSAMPEVLCFSLLILFYGLVASYLKRGRKAWKLGLSVALGVLLTLMRPYLVLFLLLPLGLWIGWGKGWKSKAGAALVLAGTAACYVLIKHYLGAEYFTPLFKTDWLEKFFEDGVWTGCRNVLATLWYQGKDMCFRTLEGFRSGLAEGTYFASYLVMLLLFLWQALYSWRRKQWEDLILYGHMALSFVAMLAALLLMYKLTEGSKHLLTFLAAGLFLVSLMETRFFKKAMVLGALFAFLFAGKWWNVADARLPFVSEERQQKLEAWQDALDRELELERDGAPSFQNVAIWVFDDEISGAVLAGMEDGADQEGVVGGSAQVVMEGGDAQSVDRRKVQTDWRMLYALPKGFGISCCYREYVIEHFEGLKSRYLMVAAGGTIDGLCRDAGWREVFRLEDAVMFARY